MVSVAPGSIEGPQGDSTEVSGLSLLGSLVIVARHSGLQLAVPQLIHDHLLEPGQPSVAQLVNVANASGLRATSVRLTWKELTGLGKALPAIVLLRNGNAMVLRYVNTGGQPPSVVLQDPNAHEDAPADSRRAAIHCRMDGRGSPVQARLQPARRRSAVRNMDDRRSAAARPAHRPRYRHRGVHTQSPGDLADHVLAAVVRQGDLLHSLQHVRGVMPRDGGAGRVRGSVSPTCASYLLFISRRASTSSSRLTCSTRS